LTDLAEGGAWQSFISFFFSYDSDDEFCRIELMRAWGGTLIAKRAAGLMIRSFVAHGATVCRFIKKFTFYKNLTQCGGSLRYILQTTGLQRYTDLLKQIHIFRKSSRL
jgi:hypothetical protein